MTSPSAKRSTSAPSHGARAAARHGVSWILCATWLVALFAESAAMLDMKSRPAAMSRRQSSVARGQRLAARVGRPTLVVLRPSALPVYRGDRAELEEVVARTRSGAAVLVSFFYAAGRSEEWTQTKRLAPRGAIPGAVILKDESGRRRKRSNAPPPGARCSMVRRANCSSMVGSPEPRPRGRKCRAGDLIALLSHRAVTTTTTPCSDAKSLLVPEMNPSTHVNLARGDAYQNSSTSWRTHLHSHR